MSAGGPTFWQQKEAIKAGSGSSGREQTTEDAESSRKKARQDFAVEGQNTNVTVAGLGTYSSEDCRGKKVIAIVHSQADALVEAEGQIGGHDRRFGGSEEEGNRSFSLANKVARTDESDDELNCHDPEVAEGLGVEPQSHSEAPTRAIPHETSSSEVNLRVNHISLNSRDNPHSNQCRTTHRTQRDNIKQARNNNNNNIEQVEPCIHPSAVADKCHNILDAEDASLLLSKDKVRIEMLIRQERADLELALRLQHEWDAADRRVDRSKGSLRAYELRNSKGRTAKKKVAATREGRSRQSTLEESFTGNLRSTRKRRGHFHDS
jgi:hypothetical protein